MKPEDAIWILELIRNRDARTDAEKDAVNTAIEALKAQLSKEGTTSDLISRQQAIDAVGKYASVWMEYTDAMSKDEIAQIALNNAKSTMIRILKELPPAQPDPHEGHWIWVAGELMCPECRTIYSDLYPDYDNAVACPHCGAKMKGEPNERTD